MLIVFGSINIDIFIQSDRLPVQGETLMGKSHDILYGGKGANQAVAAALCNVKRTYMVGTVGSDEFGDRALTNLRKMGVLPTGVGRSEKETGLAVVCLDDKQENCVILSPGANLDTSADQIPEEFIDADTVVLMQMEVPHAQNWALVEQARHRGARIVLNLAPVSAVPEDVLEKIDYLIVNEVEAEQLLQILKIEEKDPVKIVRKIAHRFDLVCIMTMSSKGSYASNCGKATYKIHPLKVDAVDMTGAGDAFCGIFAAHIEQGYQLTHALHYASVGAALTCLKAGAQESIPSLGEIEDHIHLCPAPEQISEH